MEESIWGCGVHFNNKMSLQNVRTATDERRKVLIGTGGVRAGLSEEGPLQQGRENEEGSGKVCGQKLQHVQRPWG